MLPRFLAFSKHLSFEISLCSRGLTNIQFSCLSVSLCGLFLYSLLFMHLVFILVYGVRHGYTFFCCFQIVNLFGWLNSSLFIFICDVLSHQIFYCRFLGNFHRKYIKNRWAILLYVFTFALLQFILIRQLCDLLWRQRNGVNVHNRLC